MSVGRFYAGIAAVIWSPEIKRYLLLRRSEHKDFAPGKWECLTGRVDQGESFADALRREVREELGRDTTVIDILGTTHFYRGRSEPQNELVGVIYLCTLIDPDNIHISDEHAEYRWLPADEAIALLSSPDPTTQWANRVIERAEIIRPMLPGALTNFQSQNSFEFG